MLDLELIKARLAAATPGPWTASPSVQPKNVTAVAEVAHLHILAPAHPLRNSTVDANFIAHAPQDVAALVDEVERLREAIHNHRLRSYKIYKVAQAWWDEDLWAVLDNNA